MTNTTDSELVALARSGDKNAFGQLIERYQQMVKRIALGMIADEEIARELAQEARLQAYLSLDHLRDNTRFKSWLYGIVLNVCRGYLRDQKADMFSLEAITGGMYREIEFFPSDVIDPEEIAEQRELHQVVLNAIEHLSPKDRVATLLFYYEQLSLREIAAILNVSVSAVKGRLFRAREQLREHLLPLYVDIRNETGRKQRRKTMIKVTVVAVTERADGAKGSVVTLLDEARRRIMNIWIMERDAVVIALGLTGTEPIRPMSMHLVVNLLKATGIELEEVRIEELKDDIFYAVIKVRNGEVSHELDARPSDAIALAVFMDKPIYVAENVMERCALALPEGKALQLDRAREEMLKKVEVFAQRTPHSTEEVEEAHHRLLAYLMGE